jgi:hypothetical protein
MGVKNPWRLVVDASVARAAGTTQAPISKNCRITLLAIYDEGHLVVMTNDINAEWRKHNSIYARKWLGSMVARKKVVRIDIEPSLDLRKTIDQVDTSEKNRQAMAKDVHLLEAALATDRKVLSLDDVVRTLFAKLCQQYSSIKLVLWLNPNTEAEQVIQWLNLELKYDQDYCLVHWSDEAND